MDLQDITKDITSQNNYRLAQRMEKMMKTNPGYKNLSEPNRELIFNMIKKYQEKIRRGIKTSPLTVREDKYHLYQNRFKLGLSPEDLEQINDLLDSFKDY
jgi:gamma-glutamylcysteine synthetase